MSHGEEPQTSGHAVDLVLYEEVDHGDDGSEEGGGNIFPVFDCFGIGRAQGEAAESPRDCGYQV